MKIAFTECLGRADCHTYGQSIVVGQDDIREGNLCEIKKQNNFYPSFQKNRLVTLLSENISKQKQAAQCMDFLTY